MSTSSDDSETTKTFEPYSRLPIEIKSAVQDYLTDFGSLRAVSRASRECRYIIKSKFFRSHWLIDSANKFTEKELLWCDRQLNETCTHRFGRSELPDGEVEDRFKAVPSEAITFSVRGERTTKEDGSTGRTEYPHVLVKNWWLHLHLPPAIDSVHYKVEGHDDHDHRGLLSKQIAAQCTTLAKNYPHIDYISFCVSREVAQIFDDLLKETPAFTNAVISNMGAEPSVTKTIAFELQHGIVLDDPLGCSWNIRQRFRSQAEAQDDNVSAMQLAIVTVPCGKTPFAINPKTLRYPAAASPLNPGHTAGVDEERPKETLFEVMCRILTYTSMMAHPSTTLIVTGVDQWDLAAFEVPTGTTHDDMPKLIQTTMQRYLDEAGWQRVQVGADLPIHKTVILLNSAGDVVNDAGAVIDDVKHPGRITNDLSGYTVRLQVLTHQEAVVARIAPDSRGRHELA